MGKYKGNGLVRRRLTEEDLKPYPVKKRELNISSNLKMLKKENKSQVSKINKINLGLMAACTSILVITFNALPNFDYVGNAPFYILLLCVLCTVLSVVFSALVFNVAFMNLSKIGNKEKYQEYDLDTYFRQQTYYENGINYAYDLHAESKHVDNCNISADDELNSKILVKYAKELYVKKIYTLWSVIFFIIAFLSYLTTAIIYFILWIL